MKKKLTKKTLGGNKGAIKISPLGKAWKDFSRNKKSDEKLLKFYEVFLNANFWIKLDPSEEKNYAKFKKQGIKAGEKFRAAMASDDTLPLFEVNKELQKMADKGIKKGEKIAYECVRQSGGDIINGFSKNLNYSIKIKGVRDFVRLYPENVAFLKKNFKEFAR